MRFELCRSCSRHIKVGLDCPFCGAHAAPTSSSQSRWIGLALSLPLCAAVGCDGPAANTSADTKSQTAAPSDGKEVSPTPTNAEKADPPPPSEPQNEIYGTPDMIDKKLGKEEEAPTAKPAPEDTKVDEGSKQPEGDGAKLEAAPAEKPRPAMRYGAPPRPGPKPGSKPVPKK